MKTLLALVAMVLVASASAVAKDREESLLIFENRKLALALPEGMRTSAERDPNGLVIVRLSNPDQTVTGELRFLPDPDGRFLNARARKELIHEMFSDYVPSSTEKGIQFEELEPKSGKGTYCVFTDSSLIGKAKYPPGEFLHLTAGLKAWLGVVTIFRVFSNDTTSSDYQAVLRLLRESVEERGVPLK